jgi:hypothetical protein
MAVMVDINKLRYIQHEPSVTNPLASYTILYLVCDSIVIDIKVTRDIHVNKVIVQEKVWRKPPKETHNYGHASRIVREIKAVAFRTAQSGV